MRLVSRYAPPLAVMAIIFAFSAQPDLSTGLGTWDFIGRKLSHVTIYAILWLAVARATDWRRPIVATVITLLYAASDELHQSFVEGRHGTPVDVAIDSVGVAVAALAYKRTAQRRGGQPGPPWPRRWGRALTASRAR